ncbi:sigma-70 family RNA polymerase sigma factor [Streptomyces sp. NPDC097617]|uniref:sigma-70 family RNA polymerase sigma factor n=1 Tax=Streptomyces sp. NPDC097617 TaxID=3366091 RepID=UPI003812C2AB
MTQLTHAQISAAKENDLEAVSAIVRETEEYVSRRALRFASTSGHSDSDLVEDLTQVGRIAIWESLAGFSGSEPTEFMTYLGRIVSRAMADARRAATRPGVDPFIAKAFEDAICMAVGDPYEAERIAATDAMGRDRMSKDLAHAARISWMGNDSLDRPFNVDITGENISLGDVIAQEMEIPTELVEPRDVATHRRNVIRDQVHKTLGVLSDRQRHVLKAGFGISPVPQYRPGVDDAELADYMDVTPYQVQQARTKGATRFRTLYQAGAQSW